MQIICQIVRIIQWTFKSVFEVLMTYSNAIIYNRILFQIHDCVFHDVPYCTLQHGTYKNINHLLFQQTTHRIPKFPFKCVPYINSNLVRVSLRDAYE